MNTEAQKAKILEENILIAKFMGWKFKDGNPLVPSVYPSLSESSYTEADPSWLEFQDRWDWLMPVVHKLWETTSETDQQMKGLVLFELGIATPIEDVFTSCIQAIQWHNEQNKQP